MREMRERERGRERVRKRKRGGDHTDVHGCRLALSYCIRMINRLRAEMI